MFIINTADTQRVVEGPEPIPADIGLQATTAPPCSLQYHLTQNVYLQLGCLET